MPFLPSRHLPLSQRFDGTVGILYFNGFRSRGNVVNGGSSGGVVLTAAIDFRVEAIDSGAVGFAWTANEVNIAKIFRSTDAVNYYLVVPDTALTITSSTGIESGLTEATRYYYKMTFDNGISYSPVVNVTTYVITLRRGKAQQVAFNAYDN